MGFQNKYSMGIKLDQSIFSQKREKVVWLRDTSYIAVNLKNQIVNM